MYPQPFGINKKMKTRRLYICKHCLYQVGERRREVRNYTRLCKIWQNWIVKDYLGNANPAPPGNGALGASHLAGLTPRAWWGQQCARGRQWLTNEMTRARETDTHTWRSIRAHTQTLRDRSSVSVWWSTLGNAFSWYYLLVNWLSS